MTAQSEVVAARDGVLQTRAHLSETITEIDTQISELAAAVKARLDVVQIVREHPWPALAAAVGVGLFVSTSGVDAKAGSAAVQTGRQAGTATIRAAREAPGRAGGVVRGAGRGVGRYVDTLVGTLALALIDALREPRPTSPRA